MAQRERAVAVMQAPQGRPRAQAGQRVQRPPRRGACGATPGPQRDAPNGGARGAGRAARRPEPRRTCSLRGPPSCACWWSPAAPRPTAASPAPLRTRAPRAAAPPVFQIARAVRQAGFGGSRAGGRRYTAHRCAAAAPVAPRAGQRLGPQLRLGRSAANPNLQIIPAQSKRPPAARSQTRWPSACC